MHTAKRRFRRLRFSSRNSFSFSSRSSFSFLYSSSWKTVFVILIGQTCQKSTKWKSSITETKTNYFPNNTKISLSISKYVLCGGDERRMHVSSCPFQLVENIWGGQSGGREVSDFVLAWELPLPTANIMIMWMFMYLHIPIRHIIFVSRNPGATVVAEISLSRRVPYCILYFVWLGLNPQFF